MTRRRAYQQSQYVDTPVQPDELNLSVGQPSPELLPLEEIQSVSLAALREPTFLQYGARTGHRTFRDALADFISETTGERTSASRLMVTSGNSSALLLLATQLAAQSRTSPPVAVVERPTYAVAVETLAVSGFDICAVPTDHEGMDVDELCRRLEAGALRPDIVYVQPSFHNPTGASLSPRRRQLLIELARAHSFTIIADEAYQLTSFSSEHSPVSLASEDRYGVVVSLGTFSKFFAPGARLGWIESTPQRITQFSNHPTMRSGCGSNPIVAVLVEPLLRDGRVAACLQRYRATLARRSRQLIAAVARRLPDWELFLAPRGGYFLWYRLPEGQEGQALLERVSARDVSFRPGVECAGDREYVRLSFSFHGVEELEEAIDRIAESCRSRH